MKKTYSQNRKLLFAGVIFTIIISFNIILLSCGGNSNPSITIDGEKYTVSIGEIKINSSDKYKSISIELKGNNIAQKFGVEHRVGNYIKYSIGMKIVVNSEIIEATYSGDSFFKKVFFDFKTIAIPDEIIVYNWDKTSQVTFDCKTLLQNGRTDVDYKDIIIYNEDVKSEISERFEGFGKIGNIGIIVVCVLCLIIRIIIMVNEKRKWLFYLSCLLGGILLALQNPAQWVDKTEVRHYMVQGEVEFGPMFHFLLFSILYAVLIAIAIYIIALIIVLIFCAIIRK
jgi:hypothetical protein